MKCQKCQTRVYITERYMIDGKCYHKSCYESLTTDVCPLTSPHKQNDSKTDESCDQIITDNSIDRQSVERIDVISHVMDDPIDGSAHNPSINPKTSGQSTERPPKPQIPAKTFIKTLKSVNNSSDNSSQEVIKPLRRKCKDSLVLKKSSVDNEVSNNCLEDNKIADKSSEDNELPNVSLEDIKIEEKSSEDNEMTTKTSDDNESRLLTENFEKSLNISDKLTVDEVFNEVFGKSVTISDQISEISAEEEEEEDSDEEEDEEEVPPDLSPEVNDSLTAEDRDETDIPDKKVIISSEKSDKIEYPDDMNPFGDDDCEETAEEVPKASADKKTDLKIQITRRSSDELNPFADEEDFDDDSNTTPKPKPRQSLNVSTPSSAVPSPTSSLRSRKKRPAPTPPAPPSGGIPQVNSSCSLSSSFAAVSGESSRRDSLISSVSSDLGSSVPNSRTPTPLPRHRIQKSAEELSQTPENCDQNSSLRSIDSYSDLKKTPTSDLKAKKRLAPPIPSVKRTIKGSLSEIEEELNKIGDQLPDIEKRGKELEEILMKRLEDKSEEQAVAVDDKSDSVMKEFVSAARERCRLARRQKELMYMKREHKLEEIQADIEYQMRCVMAKQAAQKTEEDRKQEEELLQRLVEIIEERNVIIENMVEDENKEVEEYQRLVSKVTPKKASVSEQKEDNKKVDKHSKHNTIDKNFNKFKDKLKLKDIKEKKKLKKSAEKAEKMAEKAAEKSDSTLNKSSETLKTKSKDNSIKHLTLKSTLKPLKKSLGLKSEKKSDKRSSVVSEQTNGSNASISDNK